MRKVLFVSGTQKNIDALTGIIKDLDETMVDSVTKAQEAGRLMESGEYSMMVVNTPLEDGQGLDLCVHVCEKLMYPVLLITNNVTFERIREDMSSRGIPAMARPIDKNAYISAFHALRASSIVMENLREQNQKLRSDMEEIRLINRAKAYLIRNMGMSESQAHKLIERQAMDLRITKAQVARNILNTYYNK